VFECCFSASCSCVVHGCFGIALNAIEALCDDIECHISTDKCWHIIDHM
jgi:hypothetical protein